VAIAIGTGNIWPAQNTATPYDAAITPGATPNGVCVIIIQTTVTDMVTSVSYGTGGDAVTLTRAASPYGFATEATEAGAVYIYWAGDGATFPSGTQTVRVVRTGTTAIRMVVWTMTVTAGQQVQLDNGGTGTSASVANPSWTHSSLVNNVVAFLGIHSGLQTMTTTPATNWTRAVGNTTSEDISGTGRGWAERTLATAGSLGAGWTAGTADDFVGCSISFKEAAPPPAGGRPLQRRQPRQRRRMNRRVTYGR
jgi:hypothetical protein